MRRGDRFPIRWEGVATGILLMAMALTLAFCAPAHAVCSPTGQCTLENQFFAPWLGNPPPSPEPKTDLDKAYEICQGIRLPSMFIIPDLGNWPPEWEGDCRRVLLLWVDSAAARRQQEAKEQARRDREFVKGVAAGKKE